MAWVVLIASGILEAVWATALSKSNGFTNLAPTLVFLVAIVASMAGLAWSTKTLPIGTAYAVWVGIGASLTVAYAMATGSEPTSVVKILLIAGLIACIVGLKLVSETH